jgi:hypothetical protein
MGPEQGERHFNRLLTRLFRADETSILSMSPNRKRKNFHACAARRGGLTFEQVRDPARVPASIGEVI